MAYNIDSLIAPRATDGPTESAAQRKRAIVAVIATSAAPTGATAGIHTRNNKYLHATIVKRTAGSASVTFWGKSAFSNEWGILTWIGTAGVVAVTFAGGGQMIEPALIAGIDRVHLQTSVFAGGGTLDAWLGGSSPD